MEQEVSLIQMLDARERRVWHQQELLGAYGKPLVCFTMNIALENDAESWPNSTISKWFGIRVCGE